MRRWYVTTFKTAQQLADYLTDTETALSIERDTGVWNNHIQVVSITPFGSEWLLVGYTTVFPKK